MHSCVFVGLLIQVEAFKMALVVGFSVSNPDPQKKAARVRLPDRWDLVWPAAGHVESSGKIWESLLLRFDDRNPWGKCGLTFIWLRVKTKGTIGVSLFQCGLGCSLGVRFGF